MPTRNRKVTENLAEVQTPRFRSEAEEAAWWDDNLDRILEQTIQHLESRQMLKTVTMRLPEADLQLARVIAAKRGIRYQTYLKSVIHSSLQSEARKFSASSRPDRAGSARRVVTQRPAGKPA